MGSLPQGILRWALPGRDGRKEEGTDAGRQDQKIHAIGIKNRTFLIA